MNVDKFILSQSISHKADLSAMGAINRPLRVGVSTSITNEMLCMRGGERLLFRIEGLDRVTQSCQLKNVLVVVAQSI